MNHPTPESWMSYLYDEVSPRERATLQAHLSACAPCRAQLESWKGIQHDLSSWKVRPSARPPWILPVVRWAAAALIFLSLGFSTGRFAPPSAAQIARVKAAVEPALRDQLKAEFDASLVRAQQLTAAQTLEAANRDTQALLAELTRYLETQRQEDQTATVAQFNRLETQRLSDYRTLRQELETVALLTDAGLRRTQQQLVQLADTNPANHR